MVGERGSLSATPLLVGNGLYYFLLCMELVSLCCSIDFFLRGDNIRMKNWISPARLKSPSQQPQPVLCPARYGTQTDEHNCLSIDRVCTSTSREF